MAMPVAQLQKDALSLLQVLRGMHQGLLHFVESVTLQQHRTVVPIQVDLDAAEFGLNKVESRMELVDRGVFSEATSLDHEAAEVCLDLLAIQRSLVDSFQKMVTLYLDGSDILQPQQPMSESSVAQVTERQNTTEKSSNNSSFGESRDSEIKESRLHDKSMRESTSSVSRNSSGMGFMIALYDFQGQEPDELSFHKGDRIQVVAYDTSGWWLGQLDGIYGLFPANYTRKIHNRHSGALSLEESFSERSRGFHF